MSSSVHSASRLEVLSVVLVAGLADPPRRLVVSHRQRAPFIQHARSGGLRLEPGHVPRLADHGLEECRVEPVDVDVVSLVRSGADALELDLRPRPTRSPNGPRRRGRSSPGRGSSRARRTPAASASGPERGTSYHPRRSASTSEAYGCPAGGIEAVASRSSISPLSGAVPCQSSGTRSSGPGVVWSSGWWMGGARAGPLVKSSAR